MVVFDAAVLLLVLEPTARGPNQPGTTTPVDRARERIGFLIDQLAAGKERILIPTPALSEVLVHAGEAMA